MLNCLLFCAGVLLCVDAGFGEVGVDGDSPIERYCDPWFSGINRKTKKGSVERKKMNIKMSLSWYGCYCWVRGEFPCLVWVRCIDFF